jgi:hypothetical protein
MYRRLIHGGSAGKNVRIERKAMTLALMSLEGKKNAALVALRMAQGMGWKDEGLMCDYAITKLKLHGIRHEEAQRVVSAVWDEHFKIWDA